MATNPDDYLRFNADSIEALIKQKLAPKFPDVRFEGSTSNIFSEVVSSVFSLLLYQLNRTASNSSFSKTQSISSILSHTKLLGYNPVGHQASSMFIDGETEGLEDETSYTIPRYSYIETPVGRFSLDSDLVFTNQYPHGSIGETIVRSGMWVEHTPLFSDGSKNQKFVLTRSSDLVDHNSIHIYVREPNESWIRYEQRDSLFLSEGTDQHFEARYNERGSYDIFFGDGINGIVPSEDAEIAIYYLAIDTPSGNLEIGAFQGGFERINTNQLNEILLDTVDTSISEYLLDVSSHFIISNTSTNTEKSDPETVEEIRRNAPALFQAQNRLVTREDYRAFVANNFSEFVSDVLILSNEEFLDTYMKYYYDLGLDEPYLEARALYNQVKFSSSCNYNNIYIFVVPKTGNFASNVQKKLIVEKTDKIKSPTIEVIPSDPIYMMFSIGTPDSDITVDDLSNSRIVVERTPNSNRSSDDIKNETVAIIENYFSVRSRMFEQQINTTEMDSAILSLDGVQAVKTTNGTISNTGVRFYQYDQRFPDNVKTASSSNLFTGIFVPKLAEDNIYNKIDVI